MKYLSFCIYFLYCKIIEAFTPFLQKYIYLDKKYDIIKTLSVLLQHIPYINNQFSIETEPNLEKCKINMLITGYMEHDPKVEALQHFSLKTYKFSLNKTKKLDDKLNDKLDDKLNDKLDDKLNDK